MSNSSAVYFTDMRCNVGTSLLKKMDKLMLAAGIEKIDFDNKFAAIKLHFGEPGNLSFLRPNFAKTVADRVIALGGMPFLTDCNTLYVGRRKNALEHLEAAAENGYSAFSTHCQMIIADGLKGTDDVEVPIENGVYCKTARIGRAIMDADILISLSHFKGHEAAGFGGAIKNIGMGCGSRAGKMQMHNDGKPCVDHDFCIGCGVCQQYCAQGAISYDDEDLAMIDQDKCVGCGRCLGVCNFHAIYNPTGTSPERLNLKMAEYTKAVLSNRPHFHITVVNQVSPYCDCHSENDAAIVPDIGIFASFDPVALDKACIDAVNNAPLISDIAGNSGSDAHDHFSCIHPSTNWRTQISHAVEIGLGNADYELITVN